VYGCVNFVRCRYINMFGGRRLEEQREQTIEHGAVCCRETAAGFVVIVGLWVVCITGVLGVVY